MTDIFFELLRVSLGSQKVLSRDLNADDWQVLYEIAEKQTLQGICQAGILRLTADGSECGISDDLYWDWFGVAASIQQDNDDADKRCAKVNKVLRNAGFETCILKGQGVAKFYPNDGEIDLSQLRQTGDIDVWMWPKGDWTLSHEARVREITKFARQHGAKGEICYHHVDMHPAKDFFIEAHFTPSWMYSPINNRRLQKWLEKVAPCEMQRDYSSLEFNRIYLLIHIYRHLFREGIGLRQIVDYYFILHKQKMDEETRRDVMSFLKSLGLRKFTGALMWVLHDKLGLDDEHLLCKPNRKEGEFLLSEILLSGNFGHYDTRLKQGVKDGSLEKFWILIKRNRHFLFHYPSEVLWGPIWKMWHQMWLRGK